MTPANPDQKSFWPRMGTDFHGWEKIGAEYGSRWRMDGCCFSDDLPQSGFLCRNRDGSEFFLYEEEMLRRLDGKTIRGARNWDVTILG